MLYKKSKRPMRGVPSPISPHVSLMDIGALRRQFSRWQQWDGRRRTSYLMAVHAHTHALTQSGSG